MRRSMLFLPGNNPAMMQNGGDLGADSLILDLEDAVSPAEKDAARTLVRNALACGCFSGREVIVRINSLDTPYWEEDLRTVVPHRLALIMPPKMSDADGVIRVAGALDAIENEGGLEPGSTRLIPLLETALAIENAYRIATSHPRVAALFLGAEDFTADLRCKRTQGSEEIRYARSRLVCAARAAGIDAYDTPFTDANDIAGLRADAEYAKSLGYSGKAAINPRHVKTINTVFSPSRDDIEHAQDVFAAIEEAKRRGKGAISLNGKMIDAPIVERARQVLETAREIFGREDL